MARHVARQGDAPAEQWVLRQTMERHAHQACVLCAAAPGKMLSAACCVCRSPAVGTPKASSDPELLDAKYRVLQAAAEDLLGVSEELPGNEPLIVEELVGKLEALLQQYKAVYEAGRMSDLQSGGSGNEAGEQAAEEEKEEDEEASGREGDTVNVRDGQAAGTGATPIEGGRVGADASASKDALGIPAEDVADRSRAARDAATHKLLADVRASEKRLATAERAAALAEQLRELHVDSAEALLKLCAARCHPGALHPGSASVKKRFEATQEVKQWEESLLRLSANADMCREQLEAVAQAAGYAAAAAKVSAGAFRADSVHAGIEGVWLALVSVGAMP